MSAQRQVRAAASCLASPCTHAYIAWDNATNMLSTGFTALIAYTACSAMMLAPLHGNKMFAYKLLDVGRFSQQSESHAARLHPEYYVLCCPMVCLVRLMHDIVPSVCFTSLCGKKPPCYAGTLLVKDGSHASHEDFFENATMLTKEQKQQTKDFYMFQDEERDYFHKFENKVLSAPAGSLFLWDSRCAHQNLLPGNLP